MNHSYSERYTVVFLIDEFHPKQVVLLKRAAWKEFAPNLYTGIGGHLNPHEDHFIGAARELLEEVAIQTQLLKEFARCLIIESNKLLHYYTLIYPHVKLPACTEGTLEWVSTEKILEKDIIGTTQFVIEEWQKRNFTSTKPFTVFLHEVPGNDSLKRSLEKVVEGLVVS